MQITDRTGILRSRETDATPVRILLHDTVGGTVQGAINTLKERGLAYHYLIAKDGAIVCVVNPDEYCDHARGHSYQSIGISACCGGPFGPVNEAQTKAFKELSKHLKSRFPSLTVITGHRDVSRGRKIDPEVVGDYRKYMEDIAAYAGLKYLDHTHFKQA